MLDSNVLNFDQSSLKSSLNCLSSNKQLAFFVILCGRMIPELQKFSVETGFDGSLYRKCFEIGWLYLVGSKSLTKCDELARKCFESAPDTEKFTHPLTSSALNTALSIGALMSFLADKNIDHIVEAAGFARDSAALHAQNCESTSPHSLNLEEVMRHSLVQQELQQQTADFEFVASLPLEFSKDTILLIKERAEWNS